MNVIDQIAIFPGLILDANPQEKFGQPIPNSEGIDYIQFGNAVITNLSKLKKPPYNSTYKNYLFHIRKLYRLFKLQDTEGRILKDFVVVITKNITEDEKEILNLGAEELIKFIANSRKLGHWITFDTIKIRGDPRSIMMFYFNNTSVNLVAKILYTMPYVQTAVPKLKLFTSDVTVLEGLEKASNKQNLKHSVDKIIVAIKLFNTSYLLKYKDPYISTALVVVALESLYDLPQINTINEFIKAINETDFDNIVSTNKNIKDVILKIADNKFNKSIRSQFINTVKQYCGDNTKIEAWARDAYQVRNDIFHGNIISFDELQVSGREKKGAPKTRHLPHFEIGRDVFTFSLYLKMDELKIITISNEQWKTNEQKNIFNKIRPNKIKLQEMMDEKFSYQKFVDDEKLYREFLEKIESMTAFDYSGGTLIMQVLEKICAIGQKWFELGEKPKFEQLINDPNTRADLKRFARAVIEMLENALSSFNDILQNTPKGFELERKLWQLKNKYFGFVHDKNIFNFSLEEFIERCLRAIQFTIPFDLKGTFSK